MQKSRKNNKTRKVHAPKFQGVFSLGVVKHSMTLQQIYHLTTYGGISYMGGGMAEKN